VARLEELILSGCPVLTDTGLSGLLAASPGLRRARLSGCPGTSAEGTARAAEAASKARGRRVEVEWAR
jgi:hypothetical protein